MSSIPSVLSLPAKQRMALYAKMFRDACAMLLLPNLPVNKDDNMKAIPFIRPLCPWRKIDQYAMSVRPLRRTDVYAKLLELYNEVNDPCPVTDEVLPLSPSRDFLDEEGSYLFRFLGIDESQPPSSSEVQVTDIAQTYGDYQHLDVSFGTAKEETVYDNDSKDSEKISPQDNTQETSVESRPRVYLWGPEDWLRHPNSYCKYMDKYLFMPLESEVDSPTSLPSLGPSYGVVNDVAPDLFEVVEQIEYYFSFDNLIRDVNFRDHMDPRGWVPLPFVASLPEVRGLTTNVKVIEDAIRTSFAIEIMDGTKLIRHRHSWHRWISPKSCPAMN